MVDGYLLCSVKEVIVRLDPEAALAAVRGGVRVVSNARVKVGQHSFTEKVQ